jgi:hypothetical protein
MSLLAKKHYAAALQDNANNPPTHIVTRAAHYNVLPGASPTFVSFTGITSRFTIQHNTAGIGIGDIPYKVTFHYRRIGNPEGNLNIGIRKSAGDTFQLIAQHPVIEPRHSGIISATIQGGNEYQMVANDKISIEYPPNENNTIELTCSTGLPAGFTSQQYAGSYSATSSPLSVTITSKVLVAI